jgi:UDP-N-acetylglucosamine 4,6-dehydratase
LAKAIAPECEIKITGIRPGEKIHEVLVPRDEARQVLEYKDMFVIEPNFPWWGKSNIAGGKKVAADFEYTSDKNPQRLSPAGLKKIIEAGF